MGALLPVLERLPAPATVRISVTDRCDMACVYCRPAREARPRPAGRRLDVRQWERLLRGLLAAGLRRVRLTGGEPLLYPGLVELVRRIRALGVEDLALTTNAARLEHLAVPLREAGLSRLNLSIDSLVPSRFARITRGGRLDRVLRGIEAARRAGFDELKSNTVVLRGVNDDEPPALTRWAWSQGIIPRFIELMAIGPGGDLWPDALVTGGEVRRTLGDLIGAGPGATDPGRGPARYVPARDGSGRRVGFIAGSSDTYCACCDRLRVGSDGVLRPCLASDAGVSVVEALAAGDGDRIVRQVREAWSMKPDGTTWRGCREASARRVSMRSIGG